MFREFQGFPWFRDFNANAGFYFWYEFVTLLLFRVSSVSRDTRYLGISACRGIQGIWLISGFLGFRGFLGFPGLRAFQLPIRGSISAMNLQDY